MTWQSLVNIFSALLTPVIAIVATYIAWQQWRGNELKVRFANMQDFRYKVSIAVNGDSKRSEVTVHYRGREHG